MTHAADPQWVTQYEEETTPRPETREELRATLAELGYVIRFGGAETPSGEVAERWILWDPGPPVELALIHYEDASDEECVDAIEAWFDQVGPQWTRM